MLLDLDQINAIEPYILDDGRAILCLPADICGKKNNILHFDDATQALYYLKDLERRYRESNPQVKVG